MSTSKQFVAKNGLDNSGKVIANVADPIAATDGANRQWVLANTGAVNLTGVVTSVGAATSLGSFTSAQLLTALTDETGTGKVVFDTAPTFSAGITVTNDATINGLKIGKGASSIASNTTLGVSAINANTTGSQLVAIGTAALLANTTGASNTAVGWNSLTANTTGSTNTGVGRQSLFSNVVGSQNSAFGYLALDLSSAGSANTAVGYNAGSNITSGVNTFGTITGGSGYTDGTYPGVVLTLLSGSPATTYPTVTITVLGGTVTSCNLSSSGNGKGFIDTTTIMTIPAASIGGTGSGFSIPIASLTTGAGNTVVGANAFTGGWGSNNTVLGYNSANSIQLGAGNTILGSGVSGLANALTNNIILANGTGAIKAQHDGTNWTLTGNTTTNNVIEGYTTTVTAASTTVLTVSSTYLQFFTGTTTQIVTLPVASTMTLGQQFNIVNNSTGVVTINSSGANLVTALAANTSALVTCILISGTSAASWSSSVTGSSSNLSGVVTSSGSVTSFGTFASSVLATALTDETGTGSVVFANGPTLITPALGTPTSGVLTNCTGTASSLTAGNVVTNAAISGVVTTNGANNISSFGTFTSSALATALSDETGTGSVVFNTSPTLVTPLLGTPTSGVLTNCTGTAAGLTAGNVTTIPTLSGEVSNTGNAITLTNSAVIGKVLTGYTSGTGTVAATDTILQAIQKLNGNDSLALPLSGGSMTGSITIPTGQKITLTDAPVNGTDAVNKTYVDAGMAGLTWKNSVKAASTANLTLSGTQTVDGIALVALDRILVKDQTTTSTNGIYVVSASTWTRSTDMDQTTPMNELNSAAVFVEQGTVNADTGWTQVNNIVTLGTDAIAFTQFSGLGQVTAGTGLAKSGNTLSFGTFASSVLATALTDETGTGKVVFDTAPTFSAGITVTNDALIHGTTVGLGAGSIATNTALGVNALAANTTGYMNTAIGNGALSINTVGLLNTATGINAGKLVNSLNSLFAVSNTLIGGEAGQAQTTGNNNTALGAFSLASNTIGSANVAVGGYSLLGLAPISGSIVSISNYNATVAGTVKATCSAVHGLTGTSTQTISGTNSYDGSYTITVIDTLNFYFTHTFVATSTGAWGDATQSNNNTAVGYYAGSSITTGSGNTIIGNNAGSSIITGSNNTIIGGSTVFAYDVSNNIFISDGAGTIKAKHDNYDWFFTSNRVYGNNFVDAYVTTATAAGTTVLDYSSPAQQFFTGTSTQTVSLPDVTYVGIGTKWRIVNSSTGIVTINSSGSNLVATLAAGTSGYFTSLNNSGNTASSWNAQITGGSTAITIADDTTTVATYYPTFVTATSGTASTIKTSSTQLTYTPNTGTLFATNFSSSSDERLKTDIEDLDNGLEIINQMDPKSFKWKESGAEGYGIIAQQLELLVPSLVNTSSDTGMKSVNYDGIIGFLISAVKELSAQVQELQK